MGGDKNRDIREFNRLYKEMDEVYHEIARKMGISDSAFSIFCIIAELGDGCQQADICYQAFLNKQTVNSSVRKLERDGYVFQEPGRGRDKHIRLTPKGREFVRDKIQPVLDMEDEAFLALGQEERLEFLRLCRKYAENLRRLENELEF